MWMSHKNLSARKWLVTQMLQATRAHSRGQNKDISTNRIVRRRESLLQFFELLERERRPVATLLATQERVVVHRVGVVGHRRV